MHEPLHCNLSKATLRLLQVWSVLLRNFEFDLADPIPEADFSCLVVGPKPCQARYTRRPLSAAA